MQESISVANRYWRGTSNLRKSLNKAILDTLRPPTYLSLSQWAEEYAFLSKENSASAGKFHAFAYQNGMMDAVTDPTVTTITVMKSARCGFTKIIDHIVGYHIHQDPCPMLIVQPTKDDAEDFSRSEIAPMIRDTPVLAEIAGEVKEKDSDQRLNQRVFRTGASVKFVGANSPAGFRRISVRLVAFDEVDGFPPQGAGDEGDQIALGTKRTDTFWNRKIILGSTPTLKSTSRIEKSFLDSDQRRYYVPCPHCKHKQVLKFSNLEWKKTRDENGITIEHHPETAHFLCVNTDCRRPIEETDKHWMIENGEWIAEAPFKGHAGFHIWTAYSLFPNASWANIAAEYLRVHKDPVLYQPFVNLWLGECWEERGESIAADTLTSRCERYTGRTLPQNVLMLTAGVDVQVDRLEVQIVGWGAKEESWSLGVKTIHGDPINDGVWESLDDILQTEFRRRDGQALMIMAACIDSGFLADRVYAYTKKRQRVNVFATKGRQGLLPVWPKKASGGGKDRKENVYIVGVDTAKESVYARLRIKTFTGGFIHFATGECTDDYFHQLTAEYVATTYVKGRPVRTWVLPAKKRNEALDTYVYAFAAMKSTRINLDRRERLDDPHEREIDFDLNVAPETEIVRKPTQPRVVKKQNPFTKSSGRWF